MRFLRGRPVFEGRAFLNSFVLPQFHPADLPGIPQSQLRSSLPAQPAQSAHPPASPRPLSAHLDILVFHADPHASRLSAQTGHTSKEIERVPAREIAPICNVIKIPKS
jgi:hypothetical protein